MLFLSLCDVHEVGSGGLRALQKVPKRALARVDPLKKRALESKCTRLSAQKVIKRVTPLKRGLKELLSRVNH